MFDSNIAVSCPWVVSKGNQLYVIFWFDIGCSSVESCEVCDSIPKKLLLSPLNDIFLGHTTAVVLYQWKYYYDKQQKWLLYI